MRIATKEYKVYRYNELSKEARERADTIISMKLIEKKLIRFLMIWNFWQMVQYGTIRKPGGKNNGKNTIT